MTMNLEKIFKKYLRTNDWTVANTSQTNNGTWWKTIAGSQHQINILPNPLRFNLYVHETIGGNRNHFITTVHVIDFFNDDKRDFVGIVKHFIELEADRPLQVIMDKTATSAGEQAELDANEPDWEQYQKESQADADYDQDKLVSEYDPH